MNRKEVMEMWKERIEEANNSTGVRIWCREKGISISKYYYWHKVLVDEGMLPKYKSTAVSALNSPREKDVPQPVFAEIDLSRSMAVPVILHSSLGHIMDSQIVIQRDDCQVFVGEGFSAPTLRRVLEVIGNAS